MMRGTLRCDLPDGMLRPRYTMILALVARAVPREPFAQRTSPSTPSQGNGSPLNRRAFPNASIGVPEEDRDPPQPPNPRRATAPTRLLRANAGNGLFAVLPLFRARPGAGADVSGLTTR